MRRLENVVCHSWNAQLARNRRGHRIPPRGVLELAGCKRGSSALLNSLCGGEGKCQGPFASWRGQGRRAWQTSIKFWAIERRGLRTMSAVGEQSVHGYFSPLGAEGR